MTQLSDGKNSKRLMTIIIIDIIVIAAILIYFLIIRPYQPPTVKIHGVYVDTPTTRVQFNLTDNKGHIINENSLKGHWTMIFFGFTNCPMICPTTLSTLNKFYTFVSQELPKAEQPQIMFVSVDPERDSKEKINEYLHQFNEYFIGARGNIREVNNLQKQLLLNISTPSNHSTEIILINPDAKVQAYFQYPHQAERLVKEYLLILNTAKVPHDKDLK